MSKVAVIVFADSENHADMGRMANALEIVSEFREANEDGVLLFDGAGVTWPGKLADADHPMHGAFEKIKPAIAGACHFCSKAFKATEGVEKAGIPFLKDFNGHPSVLNLVKDGYQIITV
ncbi:MAG: hypothetical protein ABR572_11485 [Cryomorphaceae bacterium]|nr:hypothetical protein [Flavobacteriales bacterium]